jgi:predicted DNA-binding WGR domain protein/outer membrane protein assembly factor BamB
MPEETTYLELSEGSAHKFYEVTVSDAEVRIRYGRIGDPGQLQSKTFPNNEAAKADAAKKIGEKVRKGYERATAGVRAKRPVTRRDAILQQFAVSATQTRPARGAAEAPRLGGRAPVLWNFASGASAYGIHVDDDRCWVGNQAGHVFGLGADGAIHAKFKLPDGVKCIVSDGPWLYAGCDDGKVYDLGGKAPMVAYEIADDVDIYWLDIFDAVLAVSDADGGVTTINHEDESRWSKKSSGAGGWMVRCDEIGVYHGHSAGVTMYDWEDGSIIWDRKTAGAVLFGWQEEAMVYAGGVGGWIYSFTKKGEPGPIYRCDHSVFSCAASPDGKYVFGSDPSGSVYCFAENGTRLWKLATGCGVALSMQYFRDRLYIVTNKGSFACIDASEAAIAAAREGRVPEPVSIAAPAHVDTMPVEIETTSDAGAGVVLECVRQGAELRVRVTTAGYHRDWHCQFPKGIREAGARYVVDEVRESGRGGFYRVLGTIRRLS